MSKKQKLGIGILIIAVVLITISSTYAYFAFTVGQNVNQTATVRTGTMALVFADNDNGVNAALNFGESVTKNFTIENTGTLNAVAKISWDELVNTYLAKSLTYKLEYSTSEAGTYTEVISGNVPRSASAARVTLANGLGIPAGTKYYYRLTITLEYLTDVDQTADLTATLSTKFILAEGKIYQASDTLAALNLASSVATAPTAYNMFDYTYNGYEWDTENNVSLLVDGIETTEGVYATEDDFGTSYYFRGSRSLNNIVQYGTYDSDMYYYTIATNKWSTGSLEECQAESNNVSAYCTTSYKYASAGDPMYWRIVRINGDGTLRLMYIGTSPTATGINAVAGESSFNANYDDPKYTGYTYDNSAPNAGDGTASDIKNYLETWYDKNMLDEDVNIVTAQFYSDTTGYNNTQYDNSDIYTFSTEERLDRYWIVSTVTVTPTLKTAVTTETYGGVYNLKVGMLNVDELVLTGYDGIYGAWGYGDETTYPYTTFDWWYWTFSPAVFDDGNAFVFSVTYYGRVHDYFVYYNSAVVPVINLSAEYAATLTGAGTAASPYTAS